MNTAKLRLSLVIVLCLSLFCIQLPAAFGQNGNASFESLTKGQKISGFRAEAVYLNDFDKPMGARFIHERTGFTLDLLQIQSVPQSFIWVNSFTVSD